MKRSLPIRAAAALMASVWLVAAFGDLAAQTTPPPAVSSLPASQPTQPVLTPTALPASDNPSPVPHVTVDFSDGKLTVEATNESLDHILDEISRKAGIKITGGVPDERVFGIYGPGSPSAVLAELLDGTSTNLLLVEDAKGSSELILTPRRGGPSPPSPNGSSQSNSPDEERSEGQYVPPIRPYAPPTYTGRGPVAANPDGSPVTQPNSEPGDPNANKTPQQIYDQLQHALQQRQQYSPQSAPPQ